MADAVDVASRLRPADVREVVAMHGVEPISLLLAAGIDETNTYTLFNAEGVNVALAGVVPSRSCPDMAEIWCIATPDIDKHQVEFLRYSKPFIREITKPYRLVYNWVDARNTLHIKWLRWCGFTILDARDNFGAEGRSFHSFCMINPER